MNKVQEQILNNVVRPALREMNTTKVAHIVDIDNENMLATIKLNDPNGMHEKVIKNVPIQISSCGVSQAGPFIGDKVLVGFESSNILRPFIQAVYDKKHKVKTREQRLKHSRKGSFVTDMICDRSDWPITSSIWG